MIHMKPVKLKEVAWFGAIAAAILLLFAFLSAISGSDLLLFAGILGAIVFIVYLGFAKLQGDWSSLLGQGVAVGFVFCVLSDALIYLVNGAGRLGFFYRFGYLVNGNTGPVFDFVNPAGAAMVLCGLLLLFGAWLKRLVKK